MSAGPVQPNETHYSMRSALPWRQQTQTIIQPCGRNAGAVYGIVELRLGCSNTRQVYGSRRCVACETQIHVALGGEPVHGCRVSVPHAARTHTAVVTGLYMVDMSKHRRCSLYTSLCPRDPPQPFLSKQRTFTPNQASTSVLFLGGVLGRLRLQAVYAAPVTGCHG